jgi:hypothetical protein
MPRVRLIKHEAVPKSGSYYYARRQYRGNYYGNAYDQAPAPGGYRSYDGVHCYGGAYSTGTQCVVPLDR